MGIKKILITVVCVVFCIVVMSSYVLYNNKNKRITDEERILQSHADQLNTVFEEYGISNLSDSRLDPLEIDFFVILIEKGLEMKLSKQQNRYSMIT